MRLFRGVLVSAAVIGLLACGDDDDNGGTGPDDDTIDATFELVSVDGEEVPATFTFTDGVETFDVTFESGNVDLDEDGSFQATLTLSSAGDDEQFDTSGTYEITGSAITLTDETGSVTGTIDGDQLIYTDPDLQVELVFER